MKKLLNAFGLSFFVILFSCKKDADTVPPRITINNPYENSSFSVPASIQITATVEDESKIESITAEILNANQQIVAAVPVNVSDYPDHKKINLNKTFFIEDRLFPSGNYNIRIKAFDGKNSTSRYRKIYIYELPKQLQDILILRKINSNLLTVEKLYNNNFEQVLSINTDFGYADFNNRYQHLVISGSYTGNIICYKYGDYTTKWSLPSINNPGQPYCKFLTHNISQELLYVGYTLGYIKGYNQFGLSQTNVPVNANFNPLCLNEHNGKIYAYIKEINGNQKRFNVYYKNSGSMKSSLNINCDPIQIFSVNDDISVVFANENNTGKIKLYNEISNTLTDPVSYSTSMFNDAVKISEGIFVAVSNSETILYHYPNNQIITLSGISGTGIAYNPLQNELYVNNGNILYVLHAVSGTLLNQYAAAGYIEKVLLLFNK